MACWESWDPSTLACHPSLLLLLALLLFVMLLLELHFQGGGGKAGAHHRTCNRPAPTAPTAQMDIRGQARDQGALASGTRR